MSDPDRGVAEAVRRLESVADGSPELGPAVAGLVSALAPYSPVRDDRDLSAALERCIRAEVSDAVELGRTAGELLKLRHGGGDPMKLADAGEALVADPLGRALLGHALNVDGQVEVAVTRYRRRLLLGYAVPAGFGAPRLVRLANRLRHWRPGVDPAATLTDPERAAAAAIALQGYDNDYVLALEAGEAGLVSEIAPALEAATTEGPGWAGDLEALALVYAMYRPLARHPGADLIARVDRGGWSEPGRTVLARTLDEPREEAALAAEIERVGEVADPVSTAVRDQYEENPYPHWRMAPPAGETTLAALVGARLPGLPWSEGEPARVLVAGCGTGPDAVALARRLPDAEVVGTDLSVASLAFALRRARALGISNLRLVQNDVLDVARLGHRFQYVDCVGVLHHMAVPADGLIALAGVLEPGGVIRLGLYSRTARALVTRARARIRELGIAATPDAMRAYRQQILFGDEPEALWGVMRNRDFYALSQFRDLLFHVQEHVLGLPDVGEMLAAANLELLGLDLPGPAVAEAYRARFPDDPEMTVLANWDDFERDHPETFLRMYQLWCRRP